MKIKLLSIFIFSFSLSYTQDYIPMLEEEHTWSVDVFYDPFLCECPYTVTEQLMVSGAIVIEGKTYKRVLNNFGETACLVREENGIVYQRVDGFNTEFVKFDFTLEVGDAFNFYPAIYCAYNEIGNTGVEELEVINIQELFIAGADRKVITFEEDFLGFGQEIWIEGIGSLRGFDSLGVVYDITSGTRLVCFDIDGTNYFFNDATSCVNTTLGIKDFQKDVAVLHPNPIVNISILQLSSETKATNVYIYSIHGKMVKKYPVTTDYIRLNAMNFRSGVYFYQIYSEEKPLQTEKFIIK